MCSRLSFSRHFLVGAIVFAVAFGASPRANAAESVVLKYRFLRETVSVAELSALAETGKLSPSLRAYLKLAQREPDELRRALTQEVAVDPILLYRVLNTPIGEAMLDRVSEVIHTPTNRANRQSLRSALVSSALPDGQITPIETLENYPTPEVHVEGDRLVEVVQTLRRASDRIPRFGL